MDGFLIDVEQLHDDKEYRMELRHRCVTDGFFLAPLLGYHDFIRRIHQPVADLYVKKSPGMPLDAQDSVKNRMHLDPRHTFKTTWGFIDTTQWILTDPNVTIANVTATRELGKLLTDRLKKVWIQPKGKPPTILQQIFPEYVVSKAVGDYRAPCRTREEVEPTLYATSPGSAQSGWHPWIINPDDMVDGENSGIDASDASRGRIWNTWTTNLNTLRHGGYINIRGTRYHPFDTYGNILRSMNPSDWKTLIRGSVRVKTLDKYGKPKRLVEGEFPREDELDLQFRELLPYNKLRELFKEYRSFMCQQQNDPQGGGVAIFPPERYAQAQIEGSRIPSIGEVRICWRLPCKEKAFMDYAEGVAVKYIGNRLYVVDAWRGMYTPTELYERIVQTARMYQCGDLTIEQTPGSETAIPHIMNEALRANWGFRVDRPEFENNDAVRFGRLQHLEPMMQSGRLWFANDCNQVDELKNQFTNFGIVSANGFVDCVSRLASHVPASVLAREISDEHKSIMTAAREQDLYDFVFGRGGAIPVEEAIVADYQEPVRQQNSYGLTPMLGGLDG